MCVAGTLGPRDGFEYFCGNWSRDHGLYLTCAEQPAPSGPMEIEHYYPDWRNQK
jgi:hypothetical protein